MDNKPASSGSPGNELYQSGSPYQKKSLMDTNRMFKFTGNDGA